MNDAQLRDRLTKIKALFAGATTDGERQAAEAALHRIQLKMAQAKPEQEEEYRFSLSNDWSMRLFIALCRSKGLKPYRYARMRRTSICVRLLPSRVDHELWPEFQEMNAVLTQYLSELANHIISECIDRDQSEAAVVTELPASSGKAEMAGYQGAAGTRTSAPQVGQRTS